MVCRVRFFPDQSHPLDTAVRLIERAYRSGRQVAVRLEDEPQLAALSKTLWESRPGFFLPNVRVRDPIAAETPIVLLLAEETVPTPRPVWVNLARAAFASLPDCEWLFEIVGTSEADKAPARERYRYYRALGCAVDVARGTP
ncbi:hypothetical protein Hthe01_02250 [Hydrogenophilus thermoluteolus]|uniref:DNA polymerase III subunit chi n=2 Tax=Bacteria TaxID=2 RepID=UPI0024A5D290|nr:DNA polymerase III subunit chi [Hydrogenophilus thermoluteolus]GLW59876.1 hypothetical protein Hthe01_02250 [Hydrogenophilus thermoluteolus]